MAQQTQSDLAPNDDVGRIRYGAEWGRRLPPNVTRAMWDTQQVLLQRSRNEARAVKRFDPFEDMP